MQARGLSRFEMIRRDERDPFIKPKMLDFWIDDNGNFSQSRQSDQFRHQPGRHDAFGIVRYDQTGQFAQARFDIPQHALLKLWLQLTLAFHIIANDLLIVRDDPRFFDRRPVLIDDDARPAPIASDLIL